MFRQVLDALSKLQHLSDSKDYKPIDDEIPTFESIPAALKQRLKKKIVLYASFSDTSFKIIDVTAQSHTSSHTPVDDGLKHDFNANDWIIKSKEPQAHYDLAVLRSTSEL